MNAGNDIEQSFDNAGAISQQVVDLGANNPANNQQV